MGQFIVDTERINELEVVNLVDRGSLVRARIIPQLGNNLVSLELEKANNKIELIYIPTNIENLLKEPRQFYGNPILFPFPGRISGGKFTFQGQDINLPINFQDGTAIHGFVFDKKWKIIRTSEPSKKEAFLQSMFVSDNQITKYYPFPFKLEMRYTLRDSELNLLFIAHNVGELELPFGYGIHPYFLLTGRRKDWKLYCPASKNFELINVLPTGKKMPVKAEFDFLEPRSLDGMYMDDLFGDIQKAEDGSITCWLENRELGVRIEVTSDQNFEYYVLYAPREHPFICIEPYTCIPNAFNLFYEGIETGIRTLKPREKFAASISLKWKFL